MKGEPGPSGTYRAVDPDAAFGSEALKAMKLDKGKNCFKMPNDKPADLKEDLKIGEDSKETISDELTESSPSSQNSDDIALLVAEIGDLGNSESSSQDEDGNVPSGKHNNETTATRVDLAKNTLQKDINHNVDVEIFSTSQNSKAVTTKNERSADQREINNNEICSGKFKQNFPKNASKLEIKEGPKATDAFKTNEKGKIGPKFFKKGKKLNPENSIEERKSEFKPDKSANESKSFETQQTAPSTSQVEQTFKESKNDTKSTLKAKAKSGDKSRIKLGYIPEEKSEETFEMKSGNDFKNLKLVIEDDDGSTGDNSEGNTEDIPAGNTGAKLAFLRSKYFAWMKLGARGPQPVDEAAVKTEGGGGKKGGGGKGDGGGKASQNEDLAKQGPSNPPAA